MFAVVRLFSRGKPQRNDYAFAATAFASYLAIDIALGLAAAPPSELFRLPFPLSLAGVCAAALAAAFVSPQRK